MLVIGVGDPERAAATSRAPELRAKSALADPPRAIVSLAFRLLAEFKPHYLVSRLAIKASKA